MGDSRRTQYISFDLANSTGSTPYVSSEVDLINNTQTASGIVQLHSPPNQGINNVTLQTTVCLSSC